MSRQILSFLEIFVRFLCHKYIWIFIRPQKYICHILEREEGMKRGKRADNVNVKNSRLCANLKTVSKYVLCCMTM